MQLSPIKPLRKELSSSLYIGLMSGTSLDGVDGVLVACPHVVTAAEPMQLLASAYIPFSAALRQQAMDLQQSGDNEIHREAILAQAVSCCYAECVSALLNDHPGAMVAAIGAHGQTIRHRPELGYTRQTIAPALLAELTGIDVVADFRSRDIAAGGQGAPLVPAFHRAIFGKENECRVVVNIGGISNISVLHADGTTTGFDTGPGNVLMDAWIHQQQGKTYDENGAWASQGTVNATLLNVLCAEPFFQQPAPKSTGRDLFNSAWLAQKIQGFATLSPVDIQATLTLFTACTLADAITRYASDVQSVFICGGGAYNVHLLQQFEAALSHRDCAPTLATTDALGVSPSHVEALAFAWLAQRFSLRQPGNLPQVTGARSARIAGALYPA